MNTHYEKERFTCLDYLTKTFCLVRGQCEILANIVCYHISVLYPLPNSTVYLASTILSLIQRDPRSQLN